MKLQRNPESGNIIWKILLPIIFIGVAVLFTIVIVFLKGEPEKKELLVILPSVEVTTLESEPISLTVDSQGTVQARTETVITAEVSGVIEYVSPKLFSGSFFKKGDVLLELDKIEYKVALANAKGMLASAKLAFAQEKNLAEQAELDWKEMGRGEPNDLVLRKPQLEKASADIESAETALALAERNLSKTTVRAPYDGRVHTKFVDLGQVVSARMTQIARIYAIDVAEVRLPISSKEAGYIDLPETFHDGQVDRSKSAVLLSSSIGDQVWTWVGKVDRVEGVIDTTTRQVYLVARVEDPYGQANNPQRPPLKVGQYVSAEIVGKDLGEGFIIPRSALKPGDIVWIIDENNRLRITPVSIAKAGVEEVYVTGGLKSGDRLCLTQLGIVVEGMEVEIDSEISTNLVGSDL